MTDRPLYKELRRVFLDSWSDSNGWTSMLRMIAARHVVGDRVVLDWLELCRRAQPLTFGVRGNGVSTAQLVAAWRCSQSTVSRRLAAINAAPATAGLGRVERALGRHGWWRVLLP